MSTLQKHSFEEYVSQAVKAEQPGKEVAEQENLTKIENLINDVQVNVVRGILKKHPDFRSENEISILLYYFENNSQFFADNKQNLNKLTKIKLVKYLTLEQFPRHSVIFRYGQEGDKLYTIITGSVQILVPTFKNFERGDARSGSLPTEPDQLVTLIDDRLDYHVMQTLAARQYFGEVALQFQMTRTATAVCAEECEVGVISQQQY